jgi:hypothetical protein
MTSNLPGGITPSCRQLPMSLALWPSISYSVCPNPAWPLFGRPKTLKAAAYCVPMSTVLAGQQWSGQVANVATESTDQKVGGSSPSERAQVRGPSPDTGGPSCSRWEPCWEPRVHVSRRTGPGSSTLLLPELSAGPLAHGHFAGGNPARRPDGSASASSGTAGSTRASLPGPRRHGRGRCKNPHQTAAGIVIRLRYGIKGRSARKTTSTGQSAWLTYAKPPLTPPLRRIDR